MGVFARGKQALAISDRSGLRFPYTEMVREWNGSLVHYSEFEPKQPQLRTCTCWIRSSSFTKSKSTSSINSSINFIRPKSF
jgi:hypothetical protein